MGKVGIVSASAGSGKTYNLAYEYVRNVVREPELYRHILAVTFTNKATEEMKRRILSKINDLATGNEKEFLADLLRDLSIGAEEVRKRAAAVRNNILHDYSRFSILTIDKFFQRIIRSFIRELGIETNFTLELPVDNLLSKAADRVIDDISTDNALRQWIAAFVSERIDEGKQWDIRGEVIAIGREIFTEAYKKGLSSARSKESLEVIVKKAADDAKKAESEMVASANSILNMLADNSLEIADMLRGSKGVMGYIAKVAGGELIPCAESASVTSTLEKGKWYAATSRKKEIIEPLVPKLQSHLTHIHSCCGRITSAKMLRENFRNFALLTDLQRRIADIAREENILHISEVNSLLAKLISGNDTPFVFEKTGNHFSHFMIDEFQDTSLMQWDNFIPLLRNAVSQTTSTPVLLVGDVKQSIYRWRGGDWTILAEKAGMEFEETETRTLQDNYRSRRRVVEFNNAIIGRVTADDNRKVNEELERAVAADLIPRRIGERFTDAIARAYSDFAQRPADQTDEGYVTVTWYEKNESGKFVAPVVEMVEQAQRRGYAPRDIAILVREKRQGRDIAAMLLEYKSAHPDSPFSYDVITQDALVIGAAPVSGFIIACLKLAVNPDDNITLAKYNHYLGRDFTEELPDGDRGFMTHIRLLSPEEAFEEIAIRYSLGSRRGEVAYLQAIHQQIISFMASNIADIPLFTEWWRSTGFKKSIAMPSTVNAISIDTIHRSKGLGYKVVIIPYADWGMTAKTGSVIWSEPSDRKPDIGSYPVLYRREMANSIFAEEYFTEYVMAHIDNLNLLYVALTRAREELHIMIPKTKTPSAEKISTLITDAIDTADTEARLGDMEGRISTEGIFTTVKFGLPTSKYAAGDMFITGSIPATGNTAGDYLFATDGVQVTEGNSGNLPAADNTPATEEKSENLPTASGTPATGNAVGDHLFATGGTQATEGKSENMPAAGSTLATGNAAGDLPAAGSTQATVNGTGGIDTIKFVSVPPGGRIAMKLSAQRYLDDGMADDRLAPRNYGILMHKVFGQAAGLADIANAIAMLRTEGSISEDEAAEIRNEITAAFSNPVVKGWFDDSWDSVRNENNIIVQSNETYRPDRVMIKGGTAVVVDYKFGTAENPKYAKQLRSYMALLLQMGYTDVKGYIWYVTLNKVVGNQGDLSI